MTFVLVHEMAHCFHFAQSGVFSKWQSQFWGGRNGYSGSGSQVSSSVSSYGNSNSMEDFAESVRAYYMSGASMKRTHPDRYEFVKKYVMAGVEY
jgi:Mlc titration factor MtfA (ptsG expression regulator)